MRDRVRDALADLDEVSHPDVLVYVTGSYDDGRHALLERVRNELRNTGVNAFLATDVGIPLDEMDATTQSTKFARASNAVIIVIPEQGENVGVGIETAMVLEEMTEDARERVLVLHETGVRSAMMASLAERWDAAIRTFDDDESLIRGARLFIRDVIHRESTGALPSPPTGTDGDN